MTADRNGPTAEAQLVHITTVTLTDELARWENEGGAPVSTWVEERLHWAQLAESEENASERHETSYRAMK